MNVQGLYIVMMLDVQKVFDLYRYWLGKLELWLIQHAELDDWRHRPYTQWEQGGELVAYGHPYLYGDDLLPWNCTLWDAEAAVLKLPRSSTGIERHDGVVDVLGVGAQKRFSAA